MSFNIGGLLGGSSGGGILSAALDVASIAFPQLKLATTLLGAFSQAAQSGIQSGLSSAVQSAGLPKFIADMVGKELQKVFGDAAQGAGQQDAAGQSFIDKLAEGIAKNLGNELEKAGGTSGKKGWLRAIAEALGNVAKKAGDELQSMSQNITKGDSKALTEYQAAAQEFSMLMNTFTNTVKTLGEANANATRKG